MLQKTMEAYKVWHVFHQGFPRLSKHTLGEKIDCFFSDLLESLFLASYATGNKKTEYITTASAKLDVLNFFLQVSWELKCLNHKQYAAIMPLLSEVGKMIGGWMKHAERKTPQDNAGLFT